MRIDYPSMDFEGCIDQLLKNLREYFPNLPSNSFLFYDPVMNNFSWEIKRSELMTFDQAKTYFLNLCEEGRDWINLAGDSWFEQYFLVAIEYSHKKGLPRSLINLSGPSLDSNGIPLKKTRTVIIDG